MAVVLPEHGPPVMTILWIGSSSLSLQARMAHRHTVFENTVTHSHILCSRHSCRGHRRGAQRRYSTGSWLQRWSGFEGSANLSKDDPEFRNSSLDRSRLPAKDRSEAILGYDPKEEFTEPAIFEPIRFDMRASSELISSD